MSPLSISGALNERHGVASAVLGSGARCLRFVVNAQPPCRFPSSIGGAALDCFFDDKTE